MAETRASTRLTGRGWESCEDQTVRCEVCPTDGQEPTTETLLMLDMFLSLTGTNSGNMEGRNSDLPPSSSHLAFIASLFMQIILYYIYQAVTIIRPIVILFKLHIYSTK